MTTLDKDQPYKCRYKIQNGEITTVCDKQCEECKQNENK